MVANTVEQIGPFRADQVGSYLRPEILKQARADYTDSKITEKELRTVEDDAIRVLIDKQKEAGLTAVTDGEFRRKYWHFDFLAELNGIETYVKEVPGFFQGTMAKLDQYFVAGDLSFPKEHSFLDHFKFVQQWAGENHVAKITIPGPNMIFHSGVIANDRYQENPTFDSLEVIEEQIATLYQDVIQTFYDAGCRYLQFDDTSWGAFFDEKFRENVRQNGYDPNDIIKRMANITVRSLENKPEDMAVTLHICRGNFKSAWLYEGDYSAIAEDLFSRVNVDAFFLEFDTERAGDFEPLRFIKNQKVVLGLITTKTAELEDKELMKKRIQEAAKYVPLDQLCISPQCGFASTEEGNLITEEGQWKKMELVVGIARDVWQ